MKRIVSTVSILVVILLLAGCGTKADGPAEGAREWIDGIANLDGNKALKHTCLAQRDSVQQASVWASAFAVLGQLVTNRSVQIEGDISSLKFETVNSEGDQAVVRVYGELRVAVLGAAQAQQVDERWQMVREDNTWRWCGPVIETPPVASNVSSDTPLSGTSAIANGLKLDVVEVRPSKGWRTKEGWKRIEIVLSAENVSDTVGYFPSGFCGILVDTGGYERQAWSTYFPIQDKQVGLILAPGTRVKKMAIVSEIPQNQEPQSLTLYSSQWLSPCSNWKGPSGPSWSFSDLTNSVGDLEYPYDSMPTIASTAENGILQYEEPGVYKIELSNFRIENSDGGSFSLHCNYKFENIGGYDLRLPDDNHNLLVLGAGNTGRYFDYQVETNRVSPGMTDRGSLYMGYFTGKPPEWMLLSLAPSSRNQPVAQTVFKVSE